MCPSRRHNADRVDFVFPFPHYTKVNRLMCVRVVVASCLVRVYVHLAAVFFSLWVFLCDV